MGYTEGLGVVPTIVSNSTNRVQIVFEARPTKPSCVQQSVRIWLIGVMVFSEREPHCFPTCEDLPTVQEPQRKILVANVVLHFNNNSIRKWFQIIINCRSIQYHISFATKENNYHYEGSLNVNDAFNH